MRNSINRLISMLFLLVYGMVLFHSVVPHHHASGDHDSDHHHGHEIGHGHEHHHHLADAYNEVVEHAHSGHYCHPYAGQDHLEEMTAGESSVSIIELPVIDLTEQQIYFVQSNSIEQLSVTKFYLRPPPIYEPPRCSNDPLRGPPSIA